MAHLLGGFFKYLAATLIFAFSLSLSFSFFSTIAPLHMPWFTFAAIGLTEFGFLCWLAVFMLQRHEDTHKTLAFVMIFVCMVAIIFTDGMELARLFGTIFFLNAIYYYGLIVLFSAHLLAFALDMFLSYFTQHPFRGGDANLIRSYGYNANLIRTPPQPQLDRGRKVRVEEEDDFDEDMEGEDGPLALPRPLPQEQELNMAQVGMAIKEGANSIMQKAKAATRRGKRAGRVRGNEKMNISGGMSSSDTPKVREQAESEA